MGRLLNILLSVLGCLTATAAFCGEQDRNLTHLPSPSQVNEDDAISRHSQSEKTEQISFKTHRLWLTSQENPCEADPGSLEAYVQSLKRIRGDSTVEPWEHYFWCLRKDHIPETTGFLEKCGVPIHIQELDEILSKMKGRNLYQFYYDHRHFSLASTLVRQNIIQQKGGIYADLEALLLLASKHSVPPPLNPYLKKLLSDPYDTSTGNFEYYRNFFTNVYEKMFSTTLQAVRAKRKNLLQSTRAVLDALTEKDSKRLSPIPYLTHRIWLTSTETPYEVPQDRLRMYFESLQHLKAANWTHHFWCLSPDKIPQTIQAMKLSGFDIRIHSLEEILPAMQGKDIFWRLYERKYYTAASDILRFNLINLKGGLYSDFGVEYVTDLTPYMERFDYLFGQEGFIAGTSFLAAPKNSAVISNLLKFLDTIDRVPLAFRNFGDGIITPPWTSLGILTIMMDQYTFPTDRILPCPYGVGSLIKTNHMASWLGEGKFGQTSLQLQPISQEVIFGNDSVFAKPYRLSLKEDSLLETYTLPIAKLLYGVEKATLDEKREALYKRFKDTYYAFQGQSNGLPIPLMSHRSWITSADQPVEVPVERLQIYLNSLQILDTSPGWQHVFWCMNKAHLPKTVKFLEEAKATLGLTVQIREITEILPSMRGRSLFEAFYKDNRFCNANDIFRLNVLFAQGGLYADMGCTFLKDLTPFLGLYDRLFFLYAWGNIDHNVCATKPGDDILDRYLNRLETLPLLPSPVKAITPTAGSQLGWTGSHHLMILLDLFSKKTDKVMFIPQGQFLTLKHARSWGVKPKFGNKSILDSKVNIFQVL